MTHSHVIVPAFSFAFAGLSAAMLPWPRDVFSSRLSCGVHASEGSAWRGVSGCSWRIGWASVSLVPLFTPQTAGHEYAGRRVREGLTAAIAGRPWRIHDLRRTVLDLDG